MARLLVVARYRTRLAEWAQRGSVERTPSAVAAQGLPWSKSVARRPNFAGARIGHYITELLDPVNFGCVRWPGSDQLACPMRPPEDRHNAYKGQPEGHAGQDWAVRMVRKSFPDLKFHLDGVVTLALTMKLRTERASSVRPGDG